MRRLISALTAAVAASSAPAAPARADDLARAVDPPPSAASAPMAPSAFPTMGRGARHMLRNGLDYLGYQEYERALVFLRKAESLQAELTPAEIQALQRGIAQAQTSMRAMTAQASAPRPRGRTAPSRALPPAPRDHVTLTSAPIEETPQPPAIIPLSANPEPPLPLEAPAPAPGPKAERLAATNATDAAAPVPASLRGFEPPSLSAPAEVQPQPAPAPAPAPTLALETVEPTPPAGLPPLPSEPMPVPEPPAPPPTIEAPMPAPLTTAVPLPDSPPPPDAAPAPIPLPVPGPEAPPAPDAPSPDAPTPEPPPLPLPETTPTPAPEPAPPVETLPPLPDLGSAPADPPLPPASEVGAPAPEPIPGDAPKSILPPELQREVEELARRQDEERRQRAATLPPAVAESAAEEPQGFSNLPLPRPPSPTEARPIRSIPLPDEFVPLPVRQFDPQRKFWAAAAPCHSTLYFQDPVLERYGQSVEQKLGPLGRFATYPIDDPSQSKLRAQILQPAFSAALFGAQIFTLPYKLVVDPPWEAEYDLGYWRPGDRVPTDLYYMPKHGIGPPLQGSRY